MTIDFLEKVVYKRIDGSLVAVEHYSSGRLCIKEVKEIVDYILEGKGNVIVEDETNGGH